MIVLSRTRQDIGAQDAIPPPMAPGYPKYNGGGASFLCGPDNPEDFLFLGRLNGDDTLTSEAPVSWLILEFT